MIVRTCTVGSLFAIRYLTAALDMKIPQFQINYSLLISDVLQLLKVHLEVPVYAPISGMPGAWWGGRRGIDISQWNKPPYLGYKPTYHPLHISYKYPMLCIVCDREIWVFVEFTKNFPMTFNTMKETMYAIWVDWEIPTKYQPLRKILMANPLPFSNIRPRPVSYTHLTLPTTPYV